MLEFPQDICLAPLATLFSQVAKSMQFHTVGMRKGMCHGWGGTQPASWVDLRAAMKTSEHCYSRGVGTYLSVFWFLFGFAV